jgi:CRISPR/Cas system-associated exonuclease Cas4 (RecB family)
MVAIPLKPELDIINRIYAGYELEDRKPDIYLGRIGSSFIGEECPRNIWLDWRAFNRKDFEGRMLRLFGTGHWQEDRVVEDLRRAGYQVWNKDEKTEKQFEYTDSSKHFITKIDGIIKGVSGYDDAMLLEIKTHNKKSFDSVVKKGVKSEKPLHYAQVQISMKLANFDRALYLAVCKDDEKLYVEIIENDEIEQEKLFKKVDKLVAARLRPAGISDDGSSFGCKFCDMKEVCVKNVEPLKNCRTCQQCVPYTDGTWVCELDSETLPIDKQLIGCEHYEAL